MTDTSPHSHHRIDYIELSTSDIEADKSFYAAAFGWEFNDYGPGYAGIKDFRDPASEVGGLNAGSAVRPGGPLVLLYTDDVDASAAAVRKAGGVVTAEPYEFPGGRRFQFTDPSGNELGAWGTH